MQQTAGGRIHARPIAVEWLQWLLMLPLILFRMLFSASPREAGDERPRSRPAPKAAGAKKASGFETSSCGIIKDSRKQGEFGAKKFIKP